MLQNKVFKIFFFFLFIYLLFLAALGLRCCAQGFPAAASRHHSLVGVRGLLIAVASLVVEYRLQGTQASVAVARAPAHGLSCPEACGGPPKPG